MEHAAQHVMAKAYIIRHHLTTESDNLGRGAYRVWDDDTFPISDTGFGRNLYEAVLDYQQKTGIGWGS